MVRLFSRLYGKGKPESSIIRSSANPGSVFVATPHKLITVESIVCYRETADTVLEFSLRNKGGELQCFGLKLINNFDCDGNEYDYRMRFGRNSGEDQTAGMIHYTLPQDIPIKVKVIFTGVPNTTTHPSGPGEIFGTMPA